MIGALSWLLTVLNMCIGITTTITSILKGISLMENPGSLTVIVIIAVIVGAFVVTDRVIYQKMRNQKLFDE